MGVVFSSTIRHPPSKPLMGPDSFPGQRLALVRPESRGSPLLRLGRRLAD